MKLEGTLDAFSLPDIFQLLAATKKTGALHVRREGGGHGVVHLRDGAITDARAQVDRQELARRLVGAGLVDDAALEHAVGRAARTPGTGLGRTLVETGGLDAATVEALAGEQSVDAVFDLLRWTEGSFAFLPDEPDPDGLGVALPVADVVTEARRRLDTWPALAAVVPSPDAVVRVVAVPGSEPSVAAGEWWLLALVDGRRTVGELVATSGRGEHAVVSVLAALVGRGLLEVRHASDEALSSHERRQGLLGGLEGSGAARPSAAPVAAAAPEAAAPSAPSAPPAPARPAPEQRSEAAPRPLARPARGVPARPVPVPRQTAPVAPGSASASADQRWTAAHGVHGVSGSAALQPELAVAPAVLPDPDLSKTLLLRLIAGVKGL